MPPKKNKGGNKNKAKKTEQVPLEQIIRKLHYTENPAVGYVPNAINLAEIPNKGRGYVAAQDIPAGSLIHRSAGFIFSEAFPDPSFLASIPENKRTSVKFLHHLLEQFEGPNSNLPPKIKAQLIRVFKTELHPRTLENFTGNQLAEAKLVADLYCDAAKITSLRVREDLVRFGLVAVMNSFQVHYNIAQHSSDDYGIFPSASFFNHSCYPNCTGFYSQKYDEYWVNALVDIKAGEEVTIPYVDLYYPRRMRHDKLQLQYEFDCQCVKCLPVDQGGDKVQNRLDMCLETFLCPIETCKGLLVKSNDPEKAGKLLCDICSNLVDEEPYEKLYVDTFPKNFRETAIAYQLGDIEAARTKVDESIALLKSSRVHPYNTYMFQFYAMQANIYKKRVNQLLPNTEIPVEDRRRAAEEVIPILQATLNTARMIFPRNHPQLGHLLMDLGSVQSILGMEQEAQENIKKAHNVLKISRGEFLASKQLNDIFGGQPKKKIPKQRK